MKAKFVVAVHVEHAVVIPLPPSEHAARVAALRQAEHAVDTAAVQASPYRPHFRGGLRLPDEARAVPGGWTGRVRAEREVLVDRRRGGCGALLAVPLQHRWSGVLGAVRRQRRGPHLSRRGPLAP